MQATHDARAGRLIHGWVAEQLQQKATEELKKQVGERIKEQPGFEASLGILASLAALGLWRRRN